MENEQGLFTDDLEDEAVGTEEEEGSEEDFEEEDGEDLEYEDSEDEGSEEDEDSEEYEDSETPEEIPETKPVFDKTQQAEVNKIIKARLERQEAKLLNDLKSVAGTDLDATEISSSARLWGLLKANPDLSKAIDQVIDQHMREGKARAPEQRNVQSKEVELNRKEAILDLKISDKTFNKNANKILSWADEQGFEVSDPKSLNMAYLAWKGSQGKVLEATRKLQEQRRQSEKKTVRQKASVQSSKSGKRKAPTDYSKMSDADVLASSGLRLFTDD